MSSMDNVSRYAQRHKAQAEFARTYEVEGHVVSTSQDWGKSFRSRPGSADWRAYCDCGWEPKTTYYGETEGLAAGGRHLKSVIRKNPDLKVTKRGQP